ncbi:MAG: hypothetical protein RLZZ618_1333 [Pseudomonadota bacterium]
MSEAVALEAPARLLQGACHLPRPGILAQPYSGPSAPLATLWDQSPHVRNVFSTDDADCAESRVGAVFRPHRLAPQQAPAPLRAGMDYLALGPLSLCRLRYGRKVDILPGPLERFYLIQIPVRGHARIEAGGQAFDSHPGCAALLSPDPDLAMRWSGDSDQIILRLDAEMVRRYCVSWCGDTSLRAPEFDPRLELARHPVLREILLTLASLGQARPQAANGTSASGGVHPADANEAATALAVVQLQNRLMAELLGNLPHTARERLLETGRPLAPRHVRVVEEYLVAHPHEAVTPESLAALVGVSARSLFLGFQRYRHISPMKFLREIRLHKVRDELLLAQRAGTVADTALAWGFSHLGRFAHDYRCLFGELPRDMAPTSLRSCPAGRAGP